MDGDCSAVTGGSPEHVHRDSTSGSSAESLESAAVSVEVLNGQHAICVADAACSGDPGQDPVDYCKRE